jgi:murein DD-endopeptidase MepM/ murein hydrolase activator NlpD
MRWLLTFLLGVVVGAGGLFAWLRQMPHDAPGGARGGGEHGFAARAAGPGHRKQAAARTEGHARPDRTRPARCVRPPPCPAEAVPAGPALAGKLMVPVDGMALASIKDNFDQPRGAERHHEALDIMAPKGTKVVAAADGKVVKLFTSKPGGLTVYQFDPTEKYAYYYAHLDHYAEGLKEGADIKRGDLIGYVGVTGNADPNAPHLHFAVFELTPEKQWWKGTPVNPYPLLAQ